MWLRVAVQLSVFDLESKRFRVGEASAKNLGLLLPVDLSPRELVWVLKGRAPQIEHDRAQVGWNADRGWYRLELSKGDERQLIEITPTDLRVRRVRHWRAGQLRYDAQFAAYDDELEVRIPVRMRFDFPASSARIDVKVVSHEINPELPAETFVLEPPRGIRTELF